MDFIQELHSILMNGISEYAGKIREHNVAIMGSYFRPPKHEKLDIELKAFFEWYEQAKVLHPFELSCLVHLKLVTIHPFSDGNGRMSRLLQNFILKKHNYPMIDIRNEAREEYYEAEEQYQMHDKEKPFVEFCLRQYVEEYKEFL
jgi:Fic family protein